MSTNNLQLMYVYNKYEEKTLKQNEGPMIDYDQYPYILRHLCCIHEVFFPQLNCYVNWVF